MSFDLFLQSFHNGEPTAFPFSLIERGFGPYTSVREEKCWVLHYPDGGRCELYVDSTQEEIDDFMAARPPASPEFWETLLDLLRETPSCLYWPGGGPVIANASVRDHLPKRMIEKLGEPTIASTPEQICEAIRKN